MTPHPFRLALLSLAFAALGHAADLATWSYKGGTDDAEWSEGVEAKSSADKVTSPGLQFGGATGRMNLTVSQVHATSLEQAETWGTYLEYRVTASAAAHPLVVTGLEFEMLRFTDKSATYSIGVIYSPDADFSSNSIVLPAQACTEVGFTKVEIKLDPKLVKPSPAGVFRLYFFASSNAGSWHAVSNVVITGDVR
jgi:hypothetical protein